MPMLSHMLPPMQVCGTCHGVSMLTGACCCCLAALDVVGMIADWQLMHHYAVQLHDLTLLHDLCYCKTACWVQIAT
jgi:hypothetical protein